MSTLQERLDAASTFLLQSPPGEVNDVFSDVRALVSDDAALEIGILPALREYNAAQLTIADLNGNKVLITDVSTLQHPTDDQEERHLDPSSATSFAFDHMRLSATDAKPHPTDPETEAIRASLAKVLSTYVSNHYSDGVSAVFALPDSNYPTPVDEPEPEPEPQAAVPAAPAAGADDDTTAILANPETGAVADEATVPSVESVHIDAEADTATTLADSEAGVVTEQAAMGAEPAVEEEDVPAVESDVLDPGDSGEEEVKDATHVEEPVVKEQKVHPTQSRRFGLYLVGNKYNPANFWTGRWRAVYVADLAEGTLSGDVQVNIHYYEQGNVQLSTSLPSHTTLSPSPSATAVLAALKAAEEAAQKQLAAANASLSEETFKGLRRALPKTRTKMSWDKVSAYRLGSEMGGGKE